MTPIQRDAHNVIQSQHADQVLGNADHLQRAVLTSSQRGGVHRELLAAAADNKAAFANARPRPGTPSQAKAAQGDAESERVEGFDDVEAAYLQVTCGAPTALPAKNLAELIATSRWEPTRDVVGGNDMPKEALDAYEAAVRDAIAACNTPNKKRIIKAALSADADHRLEQKAYKHVKSDLNRGSTRQREIFERLDKLIDEIPDDDVALHAYLQEGKKDALQNMARGWNAPDTRVLTNERVALLAARIDGKSFVESLSANTKLTHIEKVDILRGLLGPATTGKSVWIGRSPPRTYSELQMSKIFFSNQPSTAAPDDDEFFYFLQRMSYIPPGASAEDKKHHYYTGTVFQQAVLASRRGGRYVEENGEQRIVALTPLQSVWKEYGGYPHLYADRKPLLAALLSQRGEPSQFLDDAAHWDISDDAIISTLFGDFQHFFATVIQPDPMIVGIGKMLLDKSSITQKQRDLISTELLKNAFRSMEKAKTPAEKEQAVSILAATVPVLRDSLPGLSNSSKQSLAKALDVLTYGKDSRFNWFDGKEMRHLKRTNPALAREVRALSDSVKKSLGHR